MTARPLAAALLVWLVVACGPQASDESEESRVTGESQPGREPTPLSQVPPPIIPAPTGLPTRPSDTFERVRVDVVVQSVTADCVEAVTDNGVQWSLVGTDEPLEVGTRVRVTGTPMPEGRFSCSGAPLRVSRLELITG